MKIPWNVLVIATSAPRIDVTMRLHLLRLAADLAQRGEPFAMLTVVRREAPSSAHLGDGAIVTQGGGFHGWLGGSCAQPAAVREALCALADEAPRLIALSPDATPESRPGVTVLPMTCHSGGSVDIYIEPVLSAPLLVIFGVSPIAQALARLGTVMGYGVAAVDPLAEQTLFPEADHIFTDLEVKELSQRAKANPSRLYTVIASMGDQDIDALRVALDFDPAYLAVISSRTRFDQLKDTLLAEGRDPQSLDRVKSPAGLDIGAVSPQEIALSIVAEIVERRRSTFRSSPTAISEAIDPVCGMTVATEISVHRAEFGEMTYHFCGAGCRTRFLAGPEQFASSSDAGVPREE